MIWLENTAHTESQRMLYRNHTLLLYTKGTMEDNLKGNLLLCYVCSDFEIKLEVTQVNEKKMTSPIYCITPH